jgi:hypothetical protein
METTDRHVVGLHLLIGGERGEAARQRLASVLEEADVGAPDGDIFEVSVPADSREAALERVWNAVAAAGVDDEIGFAEHADTPRHWQRPT